MFKKIIYNTLAAFLGFFLVAILPFDDPFLLLIIGGLRKVLGLWGGFFCFLVLWFLGAILVAKIARFNRWAEKISQKIIKNKRVGKGYQKAKELGADLTFLFVALGPIFALPFITNRKDLTVKLFLASILSGTIWFFWYGGILYETGSYLINQFWF